MHELAADGSHGEARTFHPRRPRSRTDMYLAEDSTVGPSSKVSSQEPGVVAVVLSCLGAITTAEESIADPVA